MYFISDDKVYSTFFNEEKKMYPEVKVVRTATGQLSIEVLDTGVETKPHYRQVATQMELFAKFGAMAVLATEPEQEPEADKEPDTTQPDKADKPAKATKAKD